MNGVRECDKVYRTSVSVNYSGHPQMHKLVAMEGEFMVGGDSGGPLLLWIHDNDDDDDENDDDVDVLCVCMRAVRVMFVSHCSWY